MSSESGSFLTAAFQARNCRPPPFEVQDEDRLWCEVEDADPTIDLWTTRFKILSFAHCFPPGAFRCLIRRNPQLL